MFEAIVTELCSDEPPEDENAEPPPPSSSSSRPASAMSVRERHLRATLAMSICYAANVGGTVTTIGTPPNLFLVGLMNAEYGNEHPLNFSTWIGFALPQAILCLFFVWVWLQVTFIHNHIYVF
jgi:di/tricarboxylate transporter